MEESKVVALETPGAAERDALTEVLRQGAWRMLAQTVEAEVEAFVVAHEHIRDGEGRRLVIRNGYLPERTIQTGIGDFAVKAPRVRDRTNGRLSGDSVLRAQRYCHSLSESPLSTGRPQARLNGVKKT